MRRLEKDVSQTKVGCAPRAIPGGGGSRLTPEGRRLIERYERFRSVAERDLVRDFALSFEHDEQT